MKGKRRFTWVLLSQNAQVSEVRNGSLLLSMPNAGARDSFTRGGSEDVLREALIVVLGADFTIETMVESGSASVVAERSVADSAASSWGSPPGTARAAGAPPAPPTAPVAAPADRGSGSRLGRASARRVRGQTAARTDDERDAAATRDDSDVEETTESHTELLARHLGAEIIAEEEHDA